jgi:hypothetical protein
MKIKGVSLKIYIILSLLVVTVAVFWVLLNIFKLFSSVNDINSPAQNPPIQKKGKQKTELEIIRERQRKELEEIRKYYYTINPQKNSEEDRARQLRELRNLQEEMQKRAERGDRSIR